MHEYSPAKQLENIPAKKIGRVEIGRFFTGGNWSFFKRYNYDVFYKLHQRPPTPSNLRGGVIDSQIVVNL